MQLRPLRKKPHSSERGLVPGHLQFPLSDELVEGVDWRVDLLEEFFPSAAERFTVYVLLGGGGVEVHDRRTRGWARGFMDGRRVGFFNFFPVATGGTLALAG